MQPAGEPYPRHWEADVLLRDGSTMRIRPIRPTDADALQAFHVAQSEESIYFRFFAPLRRLPERDLERLVTVDHVDRVALVVVSGAAIVAVGRYDRIDADSAEVAFNVSDVYQGRGLGSVLLEHLAAAARERGVSTFVADVLPGNAKMIRVFTDAGYDVVQRYEDGVISLSFTIEATDRSLEVVASREQRTDAASMRMLLDPTGVLVVTDGHDAAFARRVASNLTGTLAHCVGEALADVAAQAGHTWSADLAGAPEDPLQLAVVAASPHAVLDLLAPLAARGVRGVVLLSDGFDAPDGDAPRLSDLVTAAREAGLRLIGPRSFGVSVARGDRVVNATLRTEPLTPGPAAFFCQSGAMAQEMMDEVETYGARVGTFVSAGHRADVSGNDVLQYLAGQSDVRVVGMYLESLGNPRKFARVASRVSAAVPVVAVVGASQRERSREAGTLGRGAVEEAMLAAGVLVAPTMRAMVAPTTLFAHQELPRGARVAVLTTAASVARLVAAQVAHLDPDPVVVQLPWASPPGAVVEAAATLATREDWDVALAVYSPPLGPPEAEVLEAIARLGSGERPVLAVVPGLVGVTPGLTHERTVPAFPSVEDAVAALELADAYARWRRTDRGHLVAPDGVDLRRARELVAAEVADAAPGERVRLGRDRTRELLSAFGIEVLPSREVRSTSQALAAARDLGWPVAVKSTDAMLRHRADLGGVRLDVAGPIELVEAVRQVRLRQDAHAPVEIQPMAPLGVACVVTAGEDRLLGPVVSFGLAGDATDLLDDASYAMPPLRTGDVHRLVHSVRAAPRLLGQRGGESVDVAALEDLLARVAEAVEALPQLHRVELRPALASPEGVVVLSAHVDLTPESRPDGGRRALRA
ncbi:GNAT family N-acetyltransferase [Miniimonas arenae]|uniref:GNAT family N-acetyltransferase n=1 Tax=Miniimonas arenae TaxID=676201 RepID=UPI0028AAAA2B|nr:GNAT family N-acetyltransferase [Miniimonas arenae]